MDDFYDPFAPQRIKQFRYIYEIAPIDHWDNALTPSLEEADRVLRQMPEAPRDGSVYKLMLFCHDNPELFPVYLCKAENNGTVYVFSDKDIGQTLIYRRV